MKSKPLLKLYFLVTQSMRRPVNQRTNQVFPTSNCTVYSLTTPTPSGSTNIATAMPHATPTSIPEKTCRVTGVSSTRLPVRASYVKAGNTYTTK